MSRGCALVPVWRNPLKQIVVGHSSLTLASTGMWRFPWNWLLIWRCSVFWLAHSFGEAFGGHPSRGSRPPAPGAVEKRFLGVEGIRLDQHPFQVELAQQLFQH